MPELHPLAVRKPIRKRLVLLSTPLVLLCFLLGLSADAPLVRAQTNPQPTRATLTTVHAKV